MTHADFTPRWLRGRGVEIGAFKTPIPGIAPIYYDRFEVYSGEACRVDYVGDAGQMPFRSGSLDYVASSHVLEHLANPVQALAEWCRVLRHGGIIYLVIPDRRFTWDRNRANTTSAHLLSDFVRQTSTSDPTHIDDFIDGVVWEEFLTPALRADPIYERENLRKLYHDSTAKGLEINIHFHVFEPASFRQIVHDLAAAYPRIFSWVIVDLEERFPTESPNGFLCVLRVRKNLLERIRGKWNRIFARNFLLPGARKASANPP